MRITAEKDIPGLATLSLGRFGDDPEREVEFVDTLEPGVAKAHKWVMMISTQVGCAVGCRMCDAGAMGYRGNLTADEMLAQIEHIVGRNPGLDLSRHPKVKIHFARMGEPSLNPAVLEALRRLARDFPFPGLIPSLSTVAPKSPAIRPFFEELLEIKDSCFPGGRFQLQFSLHATDARRRGEIVPIRKWELQEIADYGRRFVRKGDRRITLNFAASDGEAIDVPLLARVFDPATFLVKITPVNPTNTAEAAGLPPPWLSAPTSLSSAASRLRRRGFRVILSPSLPEEIEAETSCGQLWSGVLKERAALALRNREREARCYVTAANLPLKAREWAGRLAEGRRKNFPLHPERAGLLVVDMQRFFLNPFSPAYLPQARAVMSNVRRLVDAFRKLGRPVFFIRHAHQDVSRDGGLMALWWQKVCLEDSPDSAVSQILGAGEDETFRKCRYSAFSNPELEGALRRRGAEELVVAGIVTNLCVESSVRDAFDLGWRTFVAADATAAHSEEIHVASLKSMAQGFSCVRFTSELLEELRTGVVEPA